MKIALVYDRVNKWGGAERVLLALHEIWPEAPLYTSVYSPQDAAWAKDFQVIPSFLQKLPLARTHHELYPWLMPLAFESFSFDEYDVVISVASEFAKGIITKPQTFHLCYCLTPTRYLWSGYQDYFRYSWSRAAAQPVVSYLRSWDQIAAQRPDEYLAISKAVQERIKKYYSRESEIVYPGIDTAKFKIQNAKRKMQKEGFFLVVSRLVSYKKVNLAIQAFNQSGRPLKIVGTGREEGRLKRMARANIEFLGQLTDQELISYYQNCRALIFAGSEDLGLVSLEVQACGRPVICFRAGGVPETIIEGKTGECFYPQTVAALEKAVLKFEKSRYNADVCRQNAQRFGRQQFKSRFEEWVKLKWKQAVQNQKQK